MTRHGVLKWGFTFIGIAAAMGALSTYFLAILLVDHTTLSGLVCAFTCGVCLAAIPQLWGQR